MSKGYRLAVIGVIVAYMFFVPIDAQADELLSFPITNRTRDAAKSFLSDWADSEVIEGEFSQEKTIGSLGRTFRSSGAFFFAKGEGIVWTMEEPHPYEMVLTKSSFIQRNPDGSSTNVDVSQNAVFASFASAMLSVFSGDFVSLERHFAIYFDPRYHSGRMGLVPRDAMVFSVIQSLVIYTEGGKWRLQIHETGGDGIQYSFSIIEKRAKLSPDEQSLFH